MYLCKESLVRLGEVGAQEASYKLVELMNIINVYGHDTYVYLSFELSLIILYAIYI